VKILGIPDEPAIAGNTKEVFQHYGLSAENVACIAKEMLGC